MLDAMHTILSSTMKFIHFMLALIFLHSSKFWIIFFGFNRYLFSNFDMMPRLVVYVHIHYDTIRKKKLYSAPGWLISAKTCKRYQVENFSYVFYIGHSYFLSDLKGFCWGFTENLRRTLRLVEANNIRHADAPIRHVRLI